MARPTEKVNFRKLKKGSLVQLVEGATPVIFKGVKRFNNPGIDDLAVVVYLDSIDGLCREELPLNADYTLREDCGHSGSYLNPKSNEGRKYLKLLRGTK